MNSELFAEIKNCQTEFYKFNNKNSIFKNSQKIDLAEFISSKIDISKLLSATVYLMDPPGNKLFFDYTVFKLYANPINYDRIVDYILEYYEKFIQLYGAFEFDINLDGFTISAAQRYQEIIQKFTVKTMLFKTKYNLNITNINIYNVPNVIDIIMKYIKPYVDPGIVNIVNIYKKNSTDNAKLDVNKLFR